jgi:branched-chain amino acid transport system substrate-binding protein
MAISGTYFGDQIIRLVEKQVKEMGGILGGRDVEVVRYDEQGSTAMAQAGVTKLYYDDKVSALVWGGESGTTFDAVAEEADKFQILFVALGNVNGLENLNFTVNASVQNPYDWEGPADFINKALKPKTVALLGSDDAQSHKYLSGLKAMLESTGAQTVYEQFFNQSIIDYTPYLTKIKYVKPDVLFLFTGATETVVSVAKQITDLGGWGDIQVITTPPGEGAKNSAGAQGWYFWALWLPGQNYPGSIKFENEYKTMFKATPTSNHVYYYNCLWTAIYAIQLAGTDTDRVAIAQAARSGKLEWDTPMGRAHFAPDGTSGLNVIMVQIQDKKLVQVTTPQ